MNTSKPELSRILLLGAILVVLLIFMVLQAGWGYPSLAAGNTPNSPAAISPGQQAAIDGASQLLLLQPQTNEQLYLPLLIKP